MAQGGLWLPWYWSIIDGISNGNLLNGATQKVAFYGHVFWDGEPASKVMSSAGSQVKWLSGSGGWASGTSSVDIGIQDVDLVNGPPIRPDGTFDVRATLTGGSGITQDAWNTVPMTSGSKTITHGQMVALVFDMTARGGTDAIRTMARAGPSNSITNRPTANSFNGSGWVAGGSVLLAYLVADDGTLGIFDPAVPIGNNGAESFGDITNPDERGIIFRPPFDCTADAAWFTLSGSNSAACDSQFTIYSDPTGSPTQLFSPVSILGENYDRSATNNWLQVMIGSRIALNANTDYCLAIKATNAVVSMTTNSVPEAGLTKFLSIGGTQIKKATRNNLTGAFTPEATPTTLYYMGVRLYPTISGGGARFSATIF